MSGPELLEIGHIVKPHGVRGDVLVKLITDRTERLDAGSELQTERGGLSVERSSLQGDRWIVKFHQITDRNVAETWNQTILLAPPLPSAPGEFWVHDLIGCRVREQSGIDRGAVTAVVENPASDLLELENGFLVPLIFVTSHDNDEIIIDPPEGLFEE